MGTPASVIRAMIYFYYWHEKHKMMPKYRTTMPHMVRFVDDIFGVALVGGDNGLSRNDWCQFKNEIDNFGILTWDAEDPSKSTYFLDLAIK